MWWAEKEFANERESRICFVHCLVPKVTQVLVMTVGPQMEHTVMQATSILASIVVTFHYYHTRFLPSGKVRLQKGGRCKLPISYPLMNSPDLSMTQSTVGTVLRTGPRQPWP